MKPILLMLGALITSVVIAGCGPAVGRAVGDTENETNATAVDANVDKQLGDFKKEQNQQRQELTKDFRSEVKQTQVMFSKQEEEFYTLKNAIDELETELAVVKDSSHMTAPDQPDMTDFNAQVQQNEDFDKELISLHSRIDSLEETANYLQLILGDFDERADNIERTLDYLGSSLEDSQPNIEADIEILRAGFQQQLNAVAEQTNALAGFMEQVDSDTQEALANLNDGISDINDDISELGKPAYPISTQQQLAYDSIQIWGPEYNPDGSCHGPNDLRMCLDQIMAEIEIYDHPGDFAYIGMSIADIDDAVAATALIEEAYGSLGTPVGFQETVTTGVFLSESAANWASLVTSGFISDTEHDVIRYIKYHLHGD